MNLGAFSISLSVKDLQKSKDFYEKLGFSQMAGNIDHNYLIMKNGDHIIGLFQAMFDGNMLTFNPGWDQNAQNLDSFDDVREIQQRLKEQGLELQKEADEKTSGPEHIYLKDPDGNMILIDQHR
ncbi:VOC family protein [Chryseobacterium gambrini]|uniref:VOC family protein n=1 Tax=Chryseobacterium gambrini TaxID=373672 RepID=UPI003D0C1D20